MVKNFASWLLRKNLYIALLKLNNLKWKVKSIGEDGDRLELSYVAGNVKWCNPLWETVQQFLKKLNTGTPGWLSW